MDATASAATRKSATKKPRDEEAGYEEATPRRRQAEAADLDPGPGDDRAGRRAAAVPAARRGRGGRRAHEGDRRRSRARHRELVVADARPGVRNQARGVRARDPAAYEQARWAQLDTAIRAIRAAGLQALIDIGFWAPHWATDDPPGPRARSNIDPIAYGDFATAVALRYSGTFSRPADPPKAAPAPAPDPAPTEDASLIGGLITPLVPFPLTDPDAPAGAADDAAAERTPAATPRPASRCRRSTSSSCGTSPTTRPCCCRSGSRTARRRPAPTCTG